MDGIRVGNRVIGTQSPVTVGWENIPKVEGGPVKRFIFTWFQPAVLFAFVVFWYYAPNSIAKASTAIGIGIGFNVLLLVLEWVNPRYKSWQLTWKELATDLFFVGLGYTVIELASYYIGSDAWADAALNYLVYDHFGWFMTWPLLVQALLILFIFEFGQYWMHRGMHNWYPLWLPHSVHHYITQLNINKGAGRQSGGAVSDRAGHRRLLRLSCRAPSCSRAPIEHGDFGIYQHINVRFNSPRWWRFLFNTTEHHSVHHSQDYEATRSNLFQRPMIFIDRIFGTCIDGEAELLGMEGGRRMSLREQLTYPFTEGWKATKGRLDPAGNWPSAGGGGRMMGNVPHAS